MSSSRKKVPRRGDAFHLAGWVFADIFLGLMVIFLISASDVSVSGVPTPVVGVGGTATPRLDPSRAFLLSPVATPVPSRPPSTPAPTPRPGESLSLVPVTLTLSINADRVLGGDPAVRASERARIALQAREVFSRGVLSSSQIAGLVLTFGGSPNTAEGPALAKAVNEVLKSEFPTTFGGAEFRDYLDLSRPRGNIGVEVFVFAAR